MRTQLKTIVNLFAMKGMVNISCDRVFLGILVLSLLSLSAMAQGDKNKDKNKDQEGGEIESREIVIEKVRQITLPKANRNFEKIPPRPAENIKAPMTYDFQSFSFQAPQVNSAVRPLKLKQETSNEVHGGYLRLGYGNYASPLLEAYLNTRKDKNKLLGAYLYHHSSGKGPIDGKNSGSGTTGISLAGSSFSEAVALSGNIGFENRTTHFYGYPSDVPVDRDSLKQSYNVFRLAGAISNAKNSDFAYKLGANFSYLSDKFDARETEVGLTFGASYELDKDSKIGLKADYSVISRKDARTDAKPRSLFTINPSYNFLAAEDLKLSVGFVAAFENDSIDSKGIHVYPDVHASYPLSPTVDAIAFLTGGIDKVSLQTLSYENLWLAPDVAIFHTNRTLDFGVGINARLGNKVAVHTGLSLTTLKNLYSYVNGPADQSKFYTVYDEGTTKRTNLYAALSYAQSEVAKFMLRGDFYGYNAGDFSEVWHRPKHKLTASASYNIYQKIILSADLIAQGGMKAFDANKDEVVKLDGAFDLNAKAEYLFSPTFSAFVQLNNITSSKYPVFLHYPVRGFQLMAGITWSF
jgi:hypothetical protein